MFIRQKSSGSLTIPPDLYNKWDITQWYRVTHKHLILGATKKGDTLHKIFEIIPDKYYSRKLWKALSNISSPYLLLPEKNIFWHHTHILQFPYFLPLKQLVRRNGISLHLILRLISDLCLSLTALHQANILHMDISADNVFYTEEGHFILGDFSESCFITSAPFPINHQTYSILPPECDTDPPTILSEQYNLGILFYILCNEGNIPPKNFPENIPQNLAIFQGMPEITDALGSILTKMLATNPSDRYADLSLLRQDIDTLLSQLPEQTPYHLHIVDETHSFHQTITTPNTSFFPGISFPFGRKILLKISVLLLGLILLLGGSMILLTNCSPGKHIFCREKNVLRSTDPISSADNPTHIGATSMPASTNDSSTILDIGNKKLNSLTAVFSEHLAFTKVEILLAENNYFTDLEEIAALSNLQELYLSGNQITSTDAFSSLSKLEILVLSDNHCTDLSGLTDLQQLHFLDLSGNHALSEVFILSELTNLNTLILSDTSVTDASIKQLQQSLPHCTIIY